MFKHELLPVVRDNFIFLKLQKYLLKFLLFLFFAAHNLSN